MDKIILFLMSYKGLTVLNSVIENGYKDLISKVIYAEDKSVVNDYSKEITQTCSKYNIDCFSKENMGETNANLLIAISWRWIIKLCKDQKLIVLHDSILPKYRGFSPLVTALLNKDKEIGVTALYATKDYDKGNIIEQSKVIIDYPIKIEQAIKKITACYVEIILILCQSIKDEVTLIGKEQIEEDASYSLWREEDDYEINWNWTADYIKRFIDAVGFPYKGASTNINSRKIRVIEGKVVSDLNIINRVAGKVIIVDKNMPVIVCGQGLFKIEQAYDDQTKEDVLPFKKFRTKLGK